nr:ribonuclease P protein component [uncultured Cohaesibacter sp.]
MLRLKKRSEFLAAASGVRLSRRGFVLQAIKRKPEDKNPSRIGFTVTKKVGNAVIRNRVKRRLREVARLFGPEHLQAGWDYVLIGRQGALHLPFDSLCADFKGCARDLAAGKTDRMRRPPKRSGKERPAPKSSNLSEKSSDGESIKSN